MKRLMSITITLLFVFALVFSLQVAETQAQSHMGDDDHMADSPWDDEHMTDSPWDDDGHMTEPPWDDDDHMNDFPWDADDHMDGFPWDDIIICQHLCIGCISGCFICGCLWGQGFDSG